MDYSSEKCESSPKLSIEDEVGGKLRSYYRKNIITKSFHQPLTHTKKREFFEGQTDSDSREIIQNFLWRFNRMKKRFCANKPENYC